MLDIDTCIEVVDCLEIVTRLAAFLACSLSVWPGLMTIVLTENIQKSYLPHFPLGYDQKYSSAESGLGFTALYPDLISGFSCSIKGLKELGVGRLSECSLEDLI